MATVIRRTNKVAGDLAAALNDLKAYTLDSLRKLQVDVSTATSAGTSFAAPGSHNDRSEFTITLANASSLATSLALVNQIKAVYEAHRVDTLAHATADATNVIAAPVATDLTTAQTLANELKADYNLHRAQASVHATNDSGNAISSPDATTQGTLNTLLNEMKTDINAHMATGCAAKSIRIVAA